MRATRSAFALTTCAMALSLTFNSCQKEPEKIVEKEVEKETTLYSSSGIIESDVQMDDDAIFEAIASLKYQANRLKSGENPSTSYQPVSLDHIDTEHFMFYIEAAIHFDFGQTDPYDANFFNTPMNFTVDKVEVNGEYLFREADLIAKFDDVYQEVLDNMPTGGQLVFCNVYGIYEDESEVEFAVDITYAGDGSSIVALDEDDDWYAFANQGYCPSPAISKDAADRLEELINWYGIHGWNGSSNTSSGGTINVCATSGWNITWVNGQYTNWHSNGSPTQWPFTSCDINACLNDTEMESNLVSFFNYANNTVLPQFGNDYGMKSAQYEDEIHNATYGEHCYAPGPSNPQYRHRTRLYVGQQVCGELPW